MKVILGAAAAIAVLVGCSAAEAAEPAVALVLGVKGSPFYQALACGAKAKAKELGLALTISAVVLGGTSLFGGIGSIAGTVVGVFIPIVLLNGFVILGIPPFWQTVATGAVLILAVWIDQLKRSARERS